MPAARSSRSRSGFRHRRPHPAPGSYDHRYYIGRWTGSRWQVHQVAFAGGELYAGQNDYTGTVAIDPVDPNHLFISTNVDPRTGGSVVSSADGHPIGRSTKAGPATVVPPGPGRRSPPTRRRTTSDPSPSPVRAATSRVLWLRGRYPSYIRYNLRVVGIVRATPTEPARRVPPTRIGGDGRPSIAGRFGGTARDDLFVSGPGADGDGFVLPVRPAGASSPNRCARRTTFRAFNPGGSGRDTLLAVPTDPSEPARTWRLNANTSITSGSLARPAKTQPIIADVDGDGRDDILWYGRGAVARPALARATRRHVPCRNR